MVLPEGAVITVGDDGSAKIGDTVLVPGDVVTVQQGKLHVEHGGGIGVVPGDAHADASPDRGPHPRPIAAAHRAARPTARRRLPDGARPSAHGHALAATGRHADADAGARPHRHAAAHDGPDAPRPRRRRRDPAAAAAGAPHRRPADRRHLDRDVPGPVVRAARDRVAHRCGPRPGLPGSRVLGTFAHPPALPLRFRVPDGVVEVKLRVIALRGDGSVLRRSNIVTVDGARPPAAARLTGGRPV